jgi:hypothetical protein
MNRLRADYVPIDPEYLVTSRYDDETGLMATYTMGMRRSTLSHVMGSTSMFINLVNAIVADTLGALIADAAAGDATAIAGIGTGVAYLTMIVELARRSFAQPPLDTRSRRRSRGANRLAARESVASAWITTHRRDLG